MKKSCATLAAVREGLFSGMLAVELEADLLTAVGDGERGRRFEEVRRNMGDE